MLRPRASLGLFTAAIAGVLGSVGHATAQGAPPPPRPLAGAETRPLWEVQLGLGAGSAFCDTDEPNSACPVKTGGALSAVGAWRFAPRAALGLELAIWSFGVRDSWRGELQRETPIKDARFGSFYAAPFLRWYWLKSGAIDPYLQGGLGIGAVNGKVENERGESFEVTVSGLVVPLAIGAEAWVSRHVRVGAQALVYAQFSSRYCDAINGAGEVCRDSAKDENAVPWRLALTGTYAFGRR
jgi:hypothetical protein